MDIRSLSTEQRLRLLEELWESLEETAEDLPLTEAQRAELDSRLDEIERGETSGIPWEVVLQRIRESAR